MAANKFKDEDGEMLENDINKYEPGKEEVAEKDRALAKRKEVAKKGISITRALISFGYENWIALEPGSILYVFLQYCHGKFTLHKIMFGF